MDRILLLEDDIKLATEVSLFLNNKGFSCDTVYDGEIFFSQSRMNNYSIYLLDINVPFVNGLEVCRRIRMSDKNIPIIMLTAYGEVEDKVSSLQLGADDYLVKPFHFEELIARIKALLRRSVHSQKPTIIYQVADLLIQTDDQIVSRAGINITLTPKEYKLLELLAASSGKTVSKQTIAKNIWDLNFATSANTIEVYISILRSKIDKPFLKPLIHTRTGYGYFLKEL